MVLKQLSVANVTTQRIDGAVPAHVHHFEDRGAALGGRCEEARAARGDANAAGLGREHFPAGRSETRRRRMPWANATKSMGASVHPCSGLPISRCSNFTSARLLFLSRMTFTGRSWAVAVVSSAIDIAKPPGRALLLEEVLHQAHQRGIMAAIMKAKS